MWQSQDDVIKDLAALDDFNVPGDKEAYKVLYPIGRGSKLKGKHGCSSKFLDSRTGEIVSDFEDNLDCSDNYEGKGRGRLLGGFSRSGFQLQQQLRLARPLGSGDEAIETYCRKKQLNANSKCSTTSASDSETKNDEVVSGFSDINLNSETMEHRVKAVRNSNTKSNALISGLLTNSEENSKIKVNAEKEYFINN